MGRGDKYHVIGKDRWTGVLDGSYVGNLILKSISAICEIKTNIGDDAGSRLSIPLPELLPILLRCCVPPLIA